MSNAVSGKNGAGKKAVPEAEIFTGIISKITGVYVLLMLTLFPVFTTDKYYNILKDRYYFFFYLTAALAAVSLLVFCVGLAGGAFRRKEDGSSPLKKYLKLSRTDICFLAFMAVCTVSTLASEWVFRAFWGNMGRLQGLFFYLLVMVSWFFVTRFLVFRPYYLYAFLAVGVFVLIWGFSDYFGMDIFCWREDADDYWGMLTYTSSIGNINTFTAVASLYFGISAVLCLEKRLPWFTYPVFFLSALGLITGSSDNALLAVAGTFALLPFFVFEDGRRIGTYVILAGLFITALVFTGWLTSVYKETPILYEGNWGILTTLGNRYWKEFLLPAAGLLASGAVLRSVLRKKENLPSKTLKILWGILCILGIAAVAAVFIDANTKAILPIPEEYRAYLVFNDRWGTNRGYAWRASFRFFRDFSLFKKLFGAGPETYAVFMTENYYHQMMEFMGVIFDSPHSEPIQYLFTTGILGFVSFYSTIVTGFLKGLKTGGYAAACAFGVAAYICASLINISVPISTPLMFLCLEMAVLIPNENEKKV